MVMLVVTDSKETEALVLISLTTQHHIKIRIINLEQ